MLNAKAPTNTCHVECSPIILFPEYPEIRRVSPSFVESPRCTIELERVDQHPSSLRWRLTLMILDTLVTWRDKDTASARGNGG